MPFYRLGDPDLPGPGDEATWPPYSGHPNDPRGAPPDESDDEPSVCRYCEKPDPDWSPADLKRGRRTKYGGIEYHCYDGYALD